MGTSAVPCCGEGSVISNTHDYMTEISAVPSCVVGCVSTSDTMMESSVPCCVDGCVSTFDTMMESAVPSCVNGCASTFDTMMDFNAVSSCVDGGGRV